MAMNCWEILEIEPTNDIKAIKRAYAKQLKKVNIDIEIERFQQLKEALDLAKGFAKVMTSEMDESNINHLSEEENESNSQFTESAQSSFDEGLKEILGDTYTSIFDEESLSSTYSEEVVEEVVSIERFDEALTNFYNERRFFDDVDGWRDFLRSFMNVDIELFTQIQKSLERFFRGNYQLMGNNVRNYFVELCQIDTSAPENTMLFDPPAMDFSFFEEIPFERRLDYFIKRNRLYMQLMDGVIGKELRSLLSSCQQIYTQDTDLALLESFVLLLEDFRFNDSKNLTRLVNLQAYSTHSNPWSFLQSYLNFMIAFKKREPDPLEPNSFYQMEQEGIPSIIYRLLLGNYAYLTKNKRYTAKYWYALQKTYPQMFTKKENQFVQKGVQSGPEKNKSFIYKWRLLIYGILVLGIVFLMVESGHTPVNFPKSTTVYTGKTLNLEDFDFKDLELPLENETSESTEESSINFEKDMTIFAPDPNDKEPVSYESYETGGFSATVPDYSHYNVNDVRAILGQPDKVVTNADELSDLLHDKELELIVEEVESKKLTEEQAKAFYAQAIDCSLVTGGDMYAFLYSNAKPNVYIYNEKVAYITPKANYVKFNGKIEE